MTSDSRCQIALRRCQEERERLEQALARCRAVETALSGWSKQELLPPTERQVPTLVQAVEALTHAAQPSSDGDDAAAAPALLKDLDLPALTESLRGALEDLRQQRTDLRERREALHRLAVAKGLPTDHTERRDHIGPFTVEHSESQSLLRFGELPPKPLEYPSAEQIFALLLSERDRLEKAARAGITEFLATIVREQQRLSSSDAVPWPDLLKAVIGKPPPKDVLTYRLALLRSQSGLEGWTSQISPPTLAEQKKAWQVPSMDRPNDQERIYRIRLIPPPAKGSEASSKEEDQGV